MIHWKPGVLFCAGGAGYVALELAWRGRSHVSMFLAGGTCFLALGSLAPRLRRLGPALRSLAGSGVITAVELATGLAANRDFQVWDYRDLPGNFLGQICLPFSALWMPLSLGAMELYGLLDRMLSPGPDPEPEP